MPVDLMAGFGAAQVRAAEQPSLDAGVPLMARAAAGLTTGCLDVLARRGRPLGRVVVLAGSGNNGGDALLAAAAIAARGCEVVVAPLGRRLHAGGLRAVRAAGARVLPPDAAAGSIARFAAASDVVLDGLLGTGASGPLRPPARQVVARIRDCAARPAVVAVDLPSGLDPDTGVASGPVLPALETVTFGAVKAGLLRNDGPRLSGRVVLVDIGLAPALDGVRPLLPAA